MKRMDIFALTITMVLLSAVPVNAVTYEFHWNFGIEVSRFLWPGDPVPVCLGDWWAGAEVYLYRVMDDGTEQPINLACDDWQISTATWFPAGFPTEDFLYCPKKLQGRMLWNTSGSYTVSAQAVFQGDKPVQTHFPVTVAVWKPVSIAFARYSDIYPANTGPTNNDSMVNGWINITPSSTNLHGLTASTITMSTEAWDMVGPHQHPHSGKKPAGIVTTPVGNQAGKLDFTYTASQVGQIEFVVASGCSVGRIATAILVNFPGLQKIPAPTSSFLYALVGDTSIHPSNHYLKSLSMLYELLNRWGNNNVLKVTYMRINDCSLQWGGIFDLYGNWSTPHSSHRIGNCTDIGWANLNQSQIQALGDILQSMKNDGFIKYYDDEGSNTHYHVVWF